MHLINKNWLVKNIFIGAISQNRDELTINQIIPEINCVHSENNFFLVLMWLAHATRLPLTMAESLDGCLGTDFI